MYGYVYKTTNLITNKIYIGQKKSKIFLQEKYLGSGKLLKKSIAKYGKENFKTELVCECNSKWELDDSEIYYIDLFDARNPQIGYNIASEVKLQLLILIKLFIYLPNNGKNMRTRVIIK